MAAVALLALALARPFIGKRSPLARLTESAATRARARRLRSTAGATTCARCSRAIVERARALTSSLQSSRGDRVRLVLAGATPRLLSWRSPEEALDILNHAARADGEPLDLAARSAR
jgi:hypothetical protein